MRVCALACAKSLSQDALKVHIMKYKCIQITWIHKKQRIEGRHVDMFSQMYQVSEAH